MQTISGVAFSDESYAFVNEIIALLKKSGECDHYRVEMNGDKGELWFAHIGQNANRKRARGVFARIAPKKSGAALRSSRFPADMLITRDSLSEILGIIEARRQITKIRDKATQRVEPNLPGTVQGGQFESKRSKH